LALLLPVLDGLRDVHQRGFLHRDVKPHNIYLTAQGRPILLDFGSARQAMGERSRSLSVVLTEGFAPFEQYTRRGGQGPWTDIYGAAATLYLLITGQTPLPAPERVQHDALIPPQQLVPELPPPLDAALLHGLAMDPHQRPPTMDQFERALHGILAGTAPPPPTEPARRGVAQDDAEAVRWYRRAAEQGDAEAQANLGWMYLQGRGVAQDHAEAVRWYRQAAEQGFSKAQFNLGWMYAEDRGVAQDYAEAARWFRQAAAHGRCAKRTTTAQSINPSGHLACCASNCASKRPTTANTIVQLTPRAG
ncbi:MAG: serine/threonine-protein kinase, partial [Candidatus Competibacteraceae bacterium]